MRGLSGDGYRDPDGPDRRTAGRKAPASRASDQREITMGVIQNGGEPVTTQHLLVRYAKRGKMRFASHLDVARAFEGGVRRADLPIAYSTGFSPHPKISYAGGAPTGVASEAEYLSLGLTARQAETQGSQRLKAALPAGVDVIDVIEGARGSGSPFGHLEASEWEVVLPGVEPVAATRAVADFLD